MAAKTLYCVCKTEYQQDEFMIECDKCKDWFHGRFVSYFSFFDLVEKQYPYYVNEVECLLYCFCFLLTERCHDQSSVIGCLILTENLGILASTIEYKICIF